MRRRAGWWWWCALVVGSLLAAASTDVRAATLHLGLGGGRSVAYTMRGGVWERAAVADLPDVGYEACPAFADLDGDGDHDALVGERGGLVLVQQNTGSDASPRWLRHPAWDPSLDVGSNAAPAAGDLDGDGDIDLLVGSRDGRVYGVENAGTRSAPLWRARPAWAIASLGQHARPALGDVSDDGVADLLVGTEAGSVLAFAGTGVPAVPFVRRVDWDLSSAGQRLAPALGDLDGDGHQDLLLADIYARVTAFRDAGPAWQPVPAWTPPDPGSGPAALGLIAAVVGGPAGPPPDGTPVARLVASPSEGAPPLAVAFDAGGSYDPDGTALTFTWDFGDADGAGPGPDPEPPADGAAVLAAKAAYSRARASHEAGHYREAVDLYLAAMAAFEPLTTVATLGPVSVRGTNQIDRVAHYYLGASAHHLAGIYIWHNLGLPPCERYATALAYARESAAQCVAGGWPSLPESSGTNKKIATATQKLRERGCPVPAALRLFAAAVTASGPRAGHEYTRPGTYVARVTVSDGTRSASAEVTIVVGGPLPSPPPGGSDGNADRFEGFGAATPGGAGGREIHVTEASDAAVRAAFGRASSGHAIVVFDVTGPIEITSPLPRLTGPFVTIEGNGATLVGTSIPRTEAIVDVRGHDYIVRNLRLRNGGDNLRATGDGAYNIVFSHISSSGAGDDGISIAFGAHDVTVQWSFLAGNTRSLFLKYGATTNLSIHHSWIMKQYMRGPLVSGSILADLRNLIVEDWVSWGTRFEAETSGNVINSLFSLGQYAYGMGGSPNALNLIQSGPVFAAGNVFAGMAEAKTRGDAPAPLPAPPVTTLPVSEMEPAVRARAGCLPRDAVDEAYIARREGWRTGRFDPYRIVP